MNQPHIRFAELVMDYFRLFHMIENRQLVFNVLRPTYEIKGKILLANLFNRNNYNPHLITQAVNELWFAAQNSRELHLIKAWRIVTDLVEKDFYIEYQFIDSDALHVIRFTGFRMTMSERDFWYDQALKIQERAANPN